ncbi:MAG TPA: gamma-glutamyl-gamma-aminobutyrate hydrolase family protein [Bacteroidota bacterium]|nr:gamma-glutamyl-gamma-aminobutyrate hydrolase family protein [Bacteroidota bacterium]
MKIAITKNSPDEEKFNHYKNWLLRFNPAVEFRELIYTSNAPDEGDDCDGLLLTGGTDLHPATFGKRPIEGQPKDIDEKRDAFEFSVLEKSLDSRKPVLGVCRGLQSANVFFGGTLYLDLEMDGFSRHSEPGGKERRHEVAIKQDSVLRHAAGSDTGVVNSFHHQAADRIGRGLKVSAQSPDGVVEALEWAEREDKSFLLLVQWHPERMKDSFNPLTESVGRIFLEEIRRCQKKH